MVEVAGNGYERGHRSGANRPFPGGKVTEHPDLISVITSDHRDVERVFSELETGTGSAEHRRALVDHVITELNLIKDIRHHIDDEEKDLLPKLQQACSPEDLRDLGEKVLRAKKFAPTRPHPSAPDRPPANLVLDAGAGLIDGLRDKLK